MTEDTLKDRFINHPQIKKLGLTEDILSEILKIYSDLALDKLLENGYLDLGNDLFVEIIHLTERVHVLRGVPYKGTRKFKLKLNVGNSVYKKIEDYYEKLREDIM